MPSPTFVEVFFGFPSEFWIFFLIGRSPFPDPSYDVPPPVSGNSVTSSLSIDELSGEGRVGCFALEVLRVLVGFWCSLAVWIFVFFVLFESFASVRRLMQAMLLDCKWQRSPRWDLRKIEVYRRRQFFTISYGKNCLSAPSSTWHSPTDCISNRLAYCSREDS